MAYFLKRIEALGTGVGFGVVINGQLVRGGSNAIEGGHMVSKACFAVSSQRSRLIICIVPLVGCRTQWKTVWLLSTWVP